MSTRSEMTVGVILSDYNVFFNCFLYVFPQAHDGLHHHPESYQFFRPLEKFNNAKPEAGKAKQMMYSSQSHGPLPQLFPM